VLTGLLKAALRGERHERRQPPKSSFSTSEGGRVLSANPDGSDLKTLADRGQKAAGTDWRFDMSRPGTFTGRTWAIPKPMTGPSSAPISTAGT